MKSSSTGTIVVVGSSNTDMIVKLREIPEPGETVIGGQFLIAPGGKGANQAVGAARAGGKVIFIGRLGSDDLGSAAIANLKRDGIDTRFVGLDRKTPSGVALIFVSASGQNSIAVASGANECLRPADVRAARGAFRNARIVLAQLETPVPTVAAVVAEAQSSGATMILNPAPACPLTDGLLGGVSILTPNENEASALSGVNVDGEKSAATAAARLHKRGVRTVIITLGPRGAYVSAPEGRRLIPGFKVKAVDTTAAGDVFNGALAVALAESKPLWDAVRFAQAAAAISVTRMGAQPSAPKRSEIMKLLKS